MADKRFPHNLNKGDCVISFISLACLLACFISVFRLLVYVFSIVIAVSINCKSLRAAKNLPLLSRLDPTMRSQKIPAASYKVHFIGPAWSS